MTWSFCWATALAPVIPNRNFAKKTIAKFIFVIYDDVLLGIATERLTNAQHNGTGVIGDDLYGREYEVTGLWEMLEQGEHILMLAPRRVGKTSLMLELHRSPRENWDVFYVDVEAGKGPADCVAAILAALAADPQYRTRFEAMPLSNAIKDVFGHLSVNTDVGALLRQWWMKYQGGAVAP